MRPAVSVCRLSGAGIGRHLPEKRHSIDESYEPTVTLIISAYNEESVIRDKLENSKALAYPADRLDILVGSACSSNQTDSIVRTHDNPRIRLLRMEERRGKTFPAGGAVRIRCPFSCQWRQSHLYDPLHTLSPYTGGRTYCPAVLPALNVCCFSRWILPRRVGQSIGNMKTDTGMISCAA